MYSKISSLAIAPMMGYTDRHFRYIYSTLFPKLSLYTEMVNLNYFLNKKEFPKIYSSNYSRVTVQLGGNEPEKYRLVADLLSDMGIEKININCGCPSPRVGKGKFGVVLMREPQLVKECTSAMLEHSNLEVSVKCRIGIGSNPDFKKLLEFIDIVATSGAKDFIVHARPAILNGISPKANRSIPRLDYTMVEKLIDERPDLNFMLNGGIESLDDIKSLNPSIKGIMVGRMAYKNTPELIESYKFIYGENINLSDSIDRIIEYIESSQSMGTHPSHIVRHLLPFKKNTANTRKWRSSIIQKSTIEEMKPYLDELKEAS